MSLRKLFELSGILIFITGVSAFAQNLAINGSFEEDMLLANAGKLSKKGFVFEFDVNRWAKGWTIDGDSSPGIFSFAENNTAPDGRRYLEIKAKKNATIYTQNPFWGHQYKCSFSAKGGQHEGSNPEIIVTAFIYKKATGAWAGYNKILGTFDLTEKEWKTYSFDIPTLGNEFIVRVAFSFKGHCDFDNFKIEENTTSASN
ncbi:MAG: hypothetical protein A2017_07210 [Lentisphaerae bacterium GWF2_44_16]|nr:MAG: hypothetical protein A2017_07210 [Lentisphaerae bacterium GWF2_44_16]